MDLRDLRRNPWYLRHASGIFRASESAACRFERASSRRSDSGTDPHDLYTVPHRKPDFEKVPRSRQIYLLDSFVPSKHCKQKQPRKCQIPGLCHIILSFPPGYAKYGFLLTSVSCSKYHFAASLKPSTKAVHPELFKPLNKCCFIRTIISGAFIKSQSSFLL